MNRSSGVLLPGSGFLNGELLATPGTRMPFHQAAAPLGWAQDTSAAMSDTDLRVTIPTNWGSSGGSVPWSQWNFAGASFNSTAFALTVAQLPAHNHTFVGDTGHAHGDAGGSNIAYNAAGGGTQLAVGGLSGTGMSTTSLGNAQTGVTVGSAGSGASITIPYTTPQIKYCQLIMCIRQ